MSRLVITVFVGLVAASCADGSRAEPQCPLTDCSGQCVDIAVDRNNCGACGMTCAAGEVCTAGTCELNCPNGLVKCDGACVDPTSDRMHCGASGDCQGASAGEVCEAGEVCDGSGTCTLSCQTGLVACSGNCIDPDSDPMYCGATGECTGHTSCESDEACVAGTCLKFILPCTLYAVEFSRAISSVNKATAALTAVSTADAIVGGAAGLAYRPDTNTVYLTSSSNDSLYTINLATGAATLVGAYGIDVVMHGLEWNSWNNKLYGMSGGNLYTINVATGAATLIGSTGITSFLNLGFDARNGVMYMTSSDTDSAYTLNLNTAGASLLGPLVTMTNPNSLAFDAELDVMYVIDSSNNELGTLNRTTGAVTTIGLMGGVNLLGMVCVP